ncbi:MAG: Gfo/Idh/MocA family oxidoreductase [Planctomycetes bacterium]|nr:Gfo/Idh/MocA family oxidoreductase [Planctomycetota bacterium]
MTRIRTAVVGAGKMGAIHAKVYSQMADCEFVGVVDVDQARGEKVAKIFGCAHYTECEQIVDRIDAVTIATPTVTHLQLAKLFLTRRIPVLIEKPLAFSIREGKKIVALAKKYDTVVAVGHSERCNPVSQALKRFDIEPKFIETQRVSPYPFRSTDVGVVFDVMIHDIDIVLSMAHSKIKKVDAVGVSVIEGGEDICNARIAFENGCIANLTASRLALRTERRLRVFSRQAYLSVDYFKKTGIVIKADPNTNVVKWIQERRLADDFDFAKVNWPDLLHIEQLQIDDREPVRLQQEAFLRAVRDRSFTPEVSAEEGLAAITCAQKIVQRLKKHNWDK